MYSSHAVGTQDENNVVEEGLLNSLVGNYFDFFAFSSKKSCHINLSVLLIKECTTALLFLWDIAVQ